MTAPFEIPPVVAVYVKTTVWPVEPLPTELVGVVSVPEPSAERMVRLGEEARSVSAPPELERSFASQLWAPALVDAVAPAPPPLVEP